MASVLVAVPALVGVMLLGLAPILITKLGLGPTPIGIGIGMLLVALAIRRRLRVGLWLGVVLAMGFIAVCGWVIVSTFPRLNEGPWNFFPIVIFVAGVLALLTAGYASHLFRSRTTFEAAWQPPDRRVALSLVGVAIATLGLEFGLG